LWPSIKYMMDTQPCPHHPFFFAIRFAYKGNMDQNHKGVARAIFDDAVDINNIPSLHICPLKQEPPVIGVYFDIPNVDGTLSDHVFERLELYQWIATPGTVRARQEVSHPINQQWVFCPSAWALVRRVSNKYQLLLQRERVALGLTPQDESPLSEEDTDLFEQTMRMANDRRFGSICKLYFSSAVILSNIISAFTSLSVAFTGKRSLRMGDYPHLNLRPNPSRKCYVFLHWWVSSDSRCP
jgi:hypothetical protein